MAQNAWRKTTELIEAAREILLAEQPMTLRQLFYRLVSVEKLMNTRGDYQRLSRVTARARESAQLPFEWIVDRSRPEYEVNAFDDLREYLGVVSRGYRRNYWPDQPAYVEIWTEKDTLTGSIEDVTNELGVTVRVGRGFVSVTRVNEIANRFAALNQQGKCIHVFYLGDHDPSGRCIEQKIRERVRRYGSGAFHMRRLAIHAGDIRKFNLPPLRVKFSDPRAVAFFAKHGNRSVEVDALPPMELRRRIREAIESVMDRDRWDRAVRVEAVELQSIANVVRMWPG